MTTFNYRNNTINSILDGEDATLEIVQASSKIVYNLVDVSYSPKRKTFRISWDLRLFDSEGNQVNGVQPFVYNLTKKEVFTAMFNVPQVTGLSPGQVYNMHCLNGLMTKAKELGEGVEHYKNDGTTFQPLVVESKDLDITPIDESNSTLVVTVANGSTSYEYSLDNTTFQASNTFTITNETTVYVRDIDLNYTKPVAIVY